jgi:hypothetical protein
MTEKPIVNAVASMAFELQELMPSLLGEVTGAPAPSVTSSEPR